MLEGWGLENQSASVECDLSHLGVLVQKLVTSIQPGCWILLNGDLGSGKTSLTQQLIKELGSASSVTSPTFSIINVINIEKPKTAVHKVCHLDLYRLKRASELNHLGLEIEFSSSSICLIEWADTIDAHEWAYFFTTTQCRKPKSILKVEIVSKDEGNQRLYTLTWLKLDEFCETPI